MGEQILSRVRRNETLSHQAAPAQTQGEAPPLNAVNPLQFAPPAVRLGAVGRPAPVSVAPVGTIQRLVSYKGLLAKPPDPKTDAAFLKLSVPEQAEVMRQHQDKDVQYEYPDQQAFYDHVQGDKGKAPVKTPITAPERKGAHKRKSRHAFNLNTKKESELTDIQGFHDLQKGNLPVWEPMGGPDNLVFTRNKARKKYVLRSRKEGATAANTAKRRKLSLTVYEEDKTGKVDWHANVGQDMASAYTDTDIKSAPTGARDSDMGGFSSSRGDFKDQSTGDTRTIGHSTAYKDTITRPKKKERTALSDGKTVTFTKNIKTTDQEQEPLPDKTPGPTPFTPEEYNIGQHGRRTQLESKVRKQKGRYMEANKIGKTPTTVKTGLQVPDEKFYKSLKPDDSFESAVSFEQHGHDWSDERKTAGGWGELWQNQKIKEEDFPQEEYYSSSEDEDWPMAMDEPSDSEYLDRFQETMTHFSNTELELGSKITLPSGDWIVTAEEANTTAGIQYRLTRTKWA